MRDTNYISPCYCKTYICNECFINILRSIGEECTICKKNFDENILENVKNEYEDIRNMESIEIDIDNESESENEDEEYAVNNYRSDNSDTILFIKICAFILSVPFLGLFTCFILEIRVESIFTFATFFMGLMTYFALYIIASLFYNIYNMFKFLINLIHRVIFLNNNYDELDRQST